MSFNHVFCQTGFDTDATSNSNKIESSNPLNMKKEEIVGDLFAPYHYQLKTASQLENTLTQFEKEKKIDSSKLNINIRDELTKQIDFLQKGILNIADQKAKREMNQNSEIFKKTRENSALTIQLNQKEKDYTELHRQLTIIKNKKIGIRYKI